MEINVNEYLKSMQFMDQSPRISMQKQPSTSEMPFSEDSTAASHSSKKR